MGRLEGKVAIITGGALGMGAAHCRRFVEEGARIVLTDVLVDEGSALAEELGDAATFLACDVVDSQDWTRATGEAERRFGRIDILVNNAGVMGPFTPIAELPEEDFRKVCDINQVGTFLGMRAVIPAMIRAGGGSIINVSSVAGLGALDAGPNVAYVASKFAVRGMTKAAAVQYGEQRIRVNSIHPGLIRTRMFDVVDDSERNVAREMGVPLGRSADPKEVANLVLYLASDEASYVSGSEFAIDGGWTAH